MIALFSSLSSPYQDYACIMKLALFWIHILFFIPRNFWDIIDTVCRTKSNISNFVKARFKENEKMILKTVSSQMWSNSFVFRSPIVRGIQYLIKRAYSAVVPQNSSNDCVTLFPNLNWRSDIAHVVHHQGLYPFHATLAYKDTC